MKKQFTLLITLLIEVFSIVTCQRSFLDTPENIQLLRSFKELSFRLFGSSGTSDSRVYKEAKSQRRIQSRISNDVPFPCNTSAARSKVIPSSINQLRPGDIDVIAAMGDSLTAGFGIYSTDITNIFVENRGASAFGGGQGTWRDTLTLPNIIKEFNPKVIGFADRDSWSHQPASRFNVAESISMSRDMPYMAKILINRMKNDPEVDIKKNWKLITIFIGSNDLCTDMCWNPSAWASLDNHKKDMLKTLRTLKRNLPRTFVSIIPPPNLRELVELKGRTELCGTTVKFECSCLFGLTWRNRRKEFYEIIERWQHLDEEIGTYPEFQTEDFTVVVQPFPIHAVFPHRPNGKGDFRYLSSDCFHLSQLSNARIAFSGWRNLLEPLGEKTRSWDELKNDLSNFPCPAVERPYLATPGNSLTSRENSTLFRRKNLI